MKSVNNTTDKRQVNILLEILKRKGVRDFILSPGSRNTPIIIGVAREAYFNKHVVLDERCAAFSALGLSRQKGCPVALVCTSGTAVLNYAPAIAEAYYQHIPLIVITADRPTELIDQDDSQTLRQPNIYANYIKYSCSLPTDISCGSDEDYIVRLINQSVNFADSYPKGPVHINIPLREPLSGLAPKEELGHLRIISTDVSQKILSNFDVDRIAKKISAYKKVMILASFGEPDKGISQSLSILSGLPQIVVLTESISNLKISSAVNAIDRTINGISDNDVERFVPELLITFGGSLVSKNIKRMLRNNRPIEHINITSSETIIDTFFSLTEHINTSAAYLFDKLAKCVRPNISRYGDDWRDLVDIMAKKKNEYVLSAPWSDLKAFSILLSAAPSETILHLSNGTPVRYGQLFDNNGFSRVDSNRGVSGIDGALSTAIGAAWGAPGKKCLLITGDMGFLYDSNAISMKEIPDTLKIVVIKNGGGGIFRFLPGTSSLPELEQYFETVQDVDVKRFADMSEFEFFTADSENSLLNTLPRFFSSISKSILEIVTPRKVNDEVLRNYFKN